MHTVVVETRPCMFCGNRSSVEVEKNAFDLWHNGAFIQDALPDASSEFRELLISGTHPSCWDEMLLEDDEDDY